MKSKSYLKETIECYLVMILIMMLFFGVIYISGVLTGTDWRSMLPDFSWDLINTWDDIKSGKP